jgi:hypothetical protein
MAPVPVLLVRSTGKAALNASTAAGQAAAARVDEVTAA